MSTEPTESSDGLTDTELDEFGRRAGEALRRPAPSDGLAGIRRSARRRTVVTAAAGGLAVIAAVAAIGAIVSRGDEPSSPPVATAPSAPPTTTTATTTPATTTTTATTTATTTPTTVVDSAGTTTAIAPAIGETVLMGRVDLDVSGLGVDPGTGSIMLQSPGRLTTLDATRLVEVSPGPCPLVDGAGQLVGSVTDEALRWSQLESTLSVIDGTEVCPIDVSADGRYLAASRLTQQDAASGELMYTTAIFTLPDRELIGEVAGRGPSFSPTSGLLVTSGFQSVTVWDPSTATPVVAVEPDVTGAARFARFTPDGRWLVSTGRQGLKVWDAASFTPGPTLTPDRFSGQALSGRVDPSGTRIAAATFFGTAIWDLATGEILLQNDVGQHGEPFDCTSDGCTVGGEIWDATWSPDGSKLLTNGIDDAVRVVDADTGDEIGTVTACFDEPAYRLAAWIDDETVVVANTDDGCIAVVRLDI